MDPLSLTGELSTLGLVPVLLWMHLKAEKRQDKQEAKIDEQRKESEQRFEAMARAWQKQLDAMMDKQEAREQAIRDRWMKVVEKVEGEKKEQVDKMTEELKNLSNRVEDVIRFISRPAGRCLRQASWRRGCGPQRPPLARPHGVDCAGDHGSQVSLQDSRHSPVSAIYVQALTQGLESAP